MAHYVDRDLHRSQQRVVLDVLAASCVALGFAWYVLSDTTEWPIALLAMTLLLLLVPATARLLAQRWPAVGYGLIVMVLTVVCIAYGIYGDLQLAYALACVPLGALALFFSPAVGWIACLVFALTILLLRPSHDLDTTAVLGVIGLCGLVQALLWAATSSAAQSAAWAAARCESTSDLLQQARDQRMHLKATQQDLLHSNAELARLSDRMADLRREADQARRAKEQFVANVSHELRTPLNMVLGFCEMIMHEPQAYGSVPPALLADLGVVFRNSRHLSALVDDILDLSQIEAGRWALTRERASIQDIVESACKAVSPLFSSKELDLAHDVGPIEPVYCDPTRIREVILNLLSNAGRFTETGGVTVHASQTGSTVTVCIEDTGPGIAREDQERLFQPFEQLGQSLSRRQGGSGLGLSISRALVELHEGKMWLESELGLGTRVSFSLPVTPRSSISDSHRRWFSPHLFREGSRQTGISPALDVLPRYVVLDKGTSLANLLTRYLDQVELVSATGLDAAVAELDRSPSRALLVNAASVQDASAKIGAIGSLPYRTPAIILSVPDVTERTDQLGVTSYLVKPVAREDLLSAIDALELAGKTILIVDDEPDALQLFKRMLVNADRGYRVLRARDGQEALAIAREDPPDAILLDLVMPNMNGFRLLQARQAEPALADIPVIIMSAQDPSRQPIISESIAMIQGHGLSAAQILSAIEGLSRLALPDASPVHRGA